MNEFIQALIKKRDEAAKEAGKYSDGKILKLIIDHDRDCEVQGDFTKQEYSKPWDEYQYYGVIKCKSDFSTVLSKVAEFGFYLSGIRKWDNDGGKKVDSYRVWLSPISEVGK